MLPTINGTLGNPKEISDFSICGAHFGEFLSLLDKFSFKPAWASATNFSHLWLLLDLNVALPMGYAKPKEWADGYEPLAAVQAVPHDLLPLFLSHTPRLLVAEKLALIGV